MQQYNIMLHFCTKTSKQYQSADRAELDNSIKSLNHSTAIINDALKVHTFTIAWTIT